MSPLVIRGQGIGQVLSRAGFGAFDYRNVLWLGMQHEVVFGFNFRDVQLREKMILLLKTTMSK